MEPEITPSGIVVTDAAGRPTSAACPQCGAPKKKRRVVRAFGGHQAVHCGYCGHRFPEGTTA